MSSYALFNLNKTYSKNKASSVPEDRNIPDEDTSTQIDINIVNTEQFNWKHYTNTDNDLLNEPKLNSYDDNEHFTDIITNHDNEYSRKLIYSQAIIANDDDYNDEQDITKKHIFSNYRSTKQNQLINTVMNANQKILKQQSSILKKQRN